MRNVLWFLIAALALSIFVMVGASPSQAQGTATPTQTVAPAATPWPTWTPLPIPSYSMEPVLPRFLGGFSRRAPAPRVGAPREGGDRDPLADWENRPVGVVPFSQYDFPKPPAPER